MRAFLLVMLVVALAGALVWSWLAGGDGAAPPLQPPGVATPTAPTPNPAPRRSGGGDAHGDADLGPGLVATRVAAPVTTAGKLADVPTAWLRVVDRQGERPLAGAPIRRMQDGSDIAFTDERGLAAVALREPEQLAVVLAGYLMRTVPTRLGTTESEPQLVAMVHDEWSIARRFELNGPDGAVAEAMVQVRPRTPAAKAAPSPIPASDEVAKRAWHEQSMLATLAAGADQHVQLNDAAAASRVHRLANGDEMRFLAAGDYVVTAATTRGLVARQDVRIDAEPRTGAPAVRLEFAAGAFLQGKVVSARDGAPVAGATLATAGDDPLGLVATTAADGTFRIGPLATEPVSLLVRHGEHEPANHGPVRAPVADLRVALTPLPTTTLSGRVRSRPDLRPIAGATVAWTPTASTLITATTGSDGTFTLRAPGGEAGRLAVQALGFVPYAELVSPGASFADYDLWPADPQVRVANKLSAVFEGVVVDAEGRPVSGCDVRWQPAQRPAPATPTGRRVLEGASLDLALGARTGDDGTFRLETNAFGPGRLVLADRPATGLETTAEAGRSSTGLRLSR